MSKTKKKVVIIGGGFAGLNAAKALGNTHFEVILFDKSNHHVFQPLLYQVASAALSPGDIAVPLREVLGKYPNVKIYMDEVININGEKKKLSLKSGNEEDFDYLIIATGAKHSYFGNDQWESFAPGLKTLSDALDIRNQTLASFERAEVNNVSKEEREALMNIVVIGAGPTGVELAGAFAEIAKQTMVQNFKNINSSDAKIYLIEGAPNVLQVYPESLSKKAQAALEDLGVTVLTNKRVTNITDEGVYLGEDFIPSKNVIWAAGNKASKILETLDVEKDNQGRAIVSEDCSTHKYPDIFVLGDAAHFKGKDGKPLPGLAPVATQQGKYIATRLLKGKKSFSYLDKGSMATIGKSKAIAQMGSIKLSGFIAWCAWCFIHILYLIDFRNKLVVFTQWLFAFIFNKRGVRLINKRE